jgi:hypothetical protein
MNTISDRVFILTIISINHPLSIRKHVIAISGLLIAGPRYVLSSVRQAFIGVSNNPYFYSCPKSIFMLFLLCFRQALLFCIR